MKKRRKKIFFSMFLGILIFMFHCDILNAATISGFSSFNSPPKISVKTSQTKFRNVEIIFGDSDGINVDTAKIYAIDSNGKKIKNVSFLAKGVVVSKEQKKIKYIISNQYLNKKAKRFHFTVEDKKGAVIDGTFRIKIKDKKSYDVDLPPVISSWSVDSKTNRIIFHTVDTVNTGLLEIYDLNKSNKNNRNRVMFSTQKVKGLQTQVDFDMLALKDKDGTFKIKVYNVDDNKQEVSYTASFVPKVTKIIFNTTTKEIEEGQNLNLETTVVPAIANVNFTSSNPQIATVDSKGNVKAISAGTTKITATAGKKTATCFITVKNKVMTYELSLNSEENSMQIAQGDIIELQENNETKYKASIIEGNIVEIINDNEGNIKSIRGIDFGTAEIKLTSDLVGQKTLKVAVVPKNRVIDYSVQSYKSILKNYNAKLNRSENFQAFAITDAGEDNQKIYITIKGKGNIGSRIHDTSSRQEMKFQDYSSHASDFEIDKDGRFLFRARKVEENSGKILVYDSFQSSDPIFVYSKPREFSIDYENDMIALFQEHDSDLSDGPDFEYGTCTIYKYSEFLKGNLVELYDFKFMPNEYVEYNNYYKETIKLQGSNGMAIHNGYLYHLRGSYSGTMYIEVWNFLGGNSVKWAKIKEPAANFFKNREAEGLKIYNDTIYIGSMKKCSSSLCYHVGYLK